MLLVEASLALRRSGRSLADLVGVRVGLGLSGRIRPVWHGRALAALDRDPTRDWPVRCEPAGLARLRHPDRRAQWLTGRLCLQDLVLADDLLTAIRPQLARCEEGDPEDVGRPLVVDDQGRLVAEVSVSHCRDYSVALLSRSRCSVDLEPRVTLDAVAAASLFDTEERRLVTTALATADAKDRPTIYWTLVECLGKLLGRPSFGRARFRLLARQPGDPADLLRFGSPVPEEEQRRRVRVDVTVFFGHVISAATTDASVHPDLWGSPSDPLNTERSRHATPCRS